MAAADGGAWRQLSDLGYEIVADIHQYREGLFELDHFIRILFPASVFLALDRPGERPVVPTSWTAIYSGNLDFARMLERILPAKERAEEGLQYLLRSGEVDFQQIYVVVPEDYQEDTRKHFAKAFKYFKVAADDLMESYIRLCACGNLLRATLRCPPRNLMDFNENIQGKIPEKLLQVSEAIAAVDRALDTVEYMLDTIGEDELPVMQFFGW